MSLIGFPSALLREQSVCWEIVGNVVSGGRTGMDAAPLVRTDGGGLWQCTLQNISLRTADQVMLWRATEADANSGATPIVVPDCNARYAPFSVPANGSIPHSNGSFFSGGNGYYETAIKATAGAAILRATTLNITVTQGSALKRGLDFSIMHTDLFWRRYRIVRVGAVVAGVTPVTISPPMREATSGSEPLDFERPRCVMRLATPDAMRAVLDLRKFGTPSVSFIETFDVN